MLTLKDNSVLIILPASIRRVKDIAFTFNPIQHLFELELFITSYTLDLKIIF